MRSKVPHARVVTGDGPIVGAIRELWHDALNGVSECLRAVAERELRQWPKTEPPAPIFSRVERPPHPFQLGEVSRRLPHILNEALHRNGIKRRVLGVYRSEMARQDVYRVKHIDCGKAFDVRIDDVIMARFERYEVVSIISREIIDAPCPLCAERAKTVPEDNIARGED